MFLYPSFYSLGAGGSTQRGGGGPGGQAGGSPQYSNGGRGPSGQY